MLAMPIAVKDRRDAVDREWLDGLLLPWVRMLWGEEAGSSVRWELFRRLILVPVLDGIVLILTLVFKEG